MATATKKENMELNTFLEQLKNRINIVDIVSRYVPLNRKGSKHWGCCPFHHEKTPSFSVDERTQFYYCFGCKEGGDVVKFVQNVEGTDFLGALRILCNITGTTMPEFSGNADTKKTEEKRKQRDRIYALLKEAGIYYYNNLVKDPNSDAYRYLTARGISKSTITKFGLGLSLGWDEIVGVMKKRGYTEEELITSGLCSKSESGKIFDAYANRIMYPIFDTYNQVVAFGGRTLDKSAYAKYKNTSDTLVFNKKKVLYGLNLVKREKLKSAINNIIVVEGYMDAISVYEAGFHNVVASMGTAFTKEQAKLVQYVTDEVLMCYDGDSAGIKGTCLAVEILKDIGISAKVVVLPKGVDPDELIKAEGDFAFQREIDNAITGVDFKIKLVKEKYSLSDNGEREKYIFGFLKIIKEIKSTAEQDIYLQQLSNESGASIDSLKRDLENVKLGNKLKYFKNEKEKEDEVEVDIKWLRYILYYVITKKAKPDEISFLSEKFKNLPLYEIYEEILKKPDTNASLILDVLSEEGKKELAEVLAISEVLKIEENMEEKFFLDCITNYKKQSIKKEIENLNKQYKLEEDNNKKKEILFKIIDLQNQLKNV